MSAPGTPVLTHRTLPIVGPGSQVEEDTLSYLEMPQGMATYRAPRLPEREELVGIDGAHALLAQVLSALTRAAAGELVEAIPVGPLSARERLLLNQVLGEGEVSAQVRGPGEAAPRLRVQESVFAGVWRVLGDDAAGPEADRIEVGALPSALIAAAHADGARRGAMLALPALPGLMNAPSILAELRTAWEAWTPAAPPHVVNLTLLPFSPEDAALIDDTLGTGSVTILSRGYGNCRIQSTERPYTWRLVYYNSQDHVILSTLEVADVPEVACAAPQDFADSVERLREVLAWLEPS